MRTSGLFLKESSITEDKLKKASALNEIAKERGETLAQMALSWVLNKDGITGVLIGASKPEQIRENAAACRYSPFSDDELRMIDEIALK